MVSYVSSASWSLVSAVVYALKASDTSMASLCKYSVGVRCPERIALLKATRHCLGLKSSGRSEHPWANACFPMCPASSQRLRAHSALQYDLHPVVLHHLEELCITRESSIFHRGAYINCFFGHAMCLSVGAEDASITWPLQAANSVSEVGNIDYNGKQQRDPMEYSNDPPTEV